jgi:hypothetical protein
MTAAIAANVTLAVALPLSAVLDAKFFGLVAYTCAYWLIASVIILAVNSAQLRSDAVGFPAYLLFMLSTPTLVAVGLAAYLSFTAILGVR